MACAPGHTLEGDPKKLKRRKRRNWIEIEETENNFKAKNAFLVLILRQ